MRQVQEERSREAGVKSSRQRGKEAAARVQCRGACSVWKRCKRVLCERRCCQAGICCYARALRGCNTRVKAPCRSPPPPPAPPCQRCLRASFFAFLFAAHAASAIAEAAGAQRSARMARLLLRRHYFFRAALLFTYGRAQHMPRGEMAGAAARAMSARRGVGKSTLSSRTPSRVGECGDPN